MYSNMAHFRLSPPRPVKAELTSSRKIPYFIEQVKCGFPSPAEDYAEQEINFNEYLIKHQAASFTIKVQGDSMDKAGIKSGDLLIVDRSITAKTGMIIVAILFGEFTVKTFIQKGEEIWLYPENESYEPIKIHKEMDFQVWGVVTHVIHHCKIS